MVPVAVCELCKALPLLLIIIIGSSISSSDGNGATHGERCWLTRCCESGSVDICWTLLLDQEELKKLLESATRPAVQELLKKELRRVDREASSRAQQSKAADASPKAATAGPPSTTKLSNYGWDQSEKFLKVYVSLEGVQKAPSENVSVEFKERSFSLLVRDFEGKSYSMSVIELLHPIDPAKSSWKVKTDSVLVMCRKTKEETWKFLTSLEKKTLDKEKPKMEEDVDPSEGLMKILKQMYDDGDDDMKRTISKAWVESREKQTQG
ncbi:unnamed protein product, partial [Lampetra planeri]